MSHSCRMEKRIAAVFSIVHGLRGYSPREHDRRCHGRNTAGAFVQPALEILGDIRVERIFLGRESEGPITPMLVHPKPWRRILADKTLELGPARLRHFLERRLRGELDSGMENNAVTSAGQRLAMDVDDYRAGPAMRPGVGEGHARF